MNLNSLEILLLFGLGIITIINLGRAILSKDKIELWSPITFVSFIFLYYTVTGPIIAIIEGNTFYKLVEHRPFFETSWIASFLSLISLVVGYELANKRLFKSATLANLENTKSINYGKIGIYLFLVGLTLFIIYTGGSIITFINPLSGGRSVDEMGYMGSLRNYFILPINFFVPASCLMLIGVQKKQLTRYIFLGCLLATIGVYLGLAFRYRLVILGMALAATHYLYNHKKPNMLFAAGVFIITITAMGIIESTRTYFGGLNLERIENRSYSEMFLKGFGESRIFGTLGLMIEHIPEDIDYIYFSPYIQGFLMPIPRSIWPEKPAGDHISKVTDLYPNDQGKGAAWPFYGEYYFSFGWTGVVLGSFLLGLILKRFFLWMKFYRTPLIIITYSTGLGCLFFICTRGYFPQHIMLFFFCLYPCFFIIRLITKSKIINKPVRH